MSESDIHISIGPAGTPAALDQHDRGLDDLDQRIGDLRRILSQGRALGPERVVALHELGTALPRVGEHDASSAKLEEAVATFRQALQEHARERDPSCGHGCKPISARR